MSERLTDEAVAQIEDRLLRSEGGTVLMSDETCQLLDVDIDRLLDDRKALLVELAATRAAVEQKDQALEAWQSVGELLIDAKGHFQPKQWALIQEAIVKGEAALAAPTPAPVEGGA